MKRTDAELVKQSTEGRLEAYDQLMKRYERLVFKVAYGYAGAREDALDISQAVFLRAYRHLGTFRGEASFKTWLMRIAYNESSNWLRRTKRHQGHDSIDEVEVPSAEQSQESVVLGHERLDRVRDKLSCLNARYRLAIELRYVQELPIREIAAVLDCSEGVAKNILFRSIRRLRNELAEAS